MNTGKKLFLCAGLLAFFLSVSAQSYSLRTNVIGLATTNLNLEASMTLNRKWSLHLPVQYNPFSLRTEYCADSRHGHEGRLRAENRMGGK